MEEGGWPGGLGSSGSASCRLEETQPLSEPVEPDRQRDDEPELSVAERQKIYSETRTQDKNWSETQSLFIHEAFKRSGTFVLFPFNKRRSYRDVICQEKQCIRTHGGLAAGLVLLLVFLDTGGDEGVFSSRGGQVLTEGGHKHGLVETFIKTEDPSAATDEGCTCTCVD